MFFPMDLRIKSDFFSIHSNNKLVFTTETECVYCAVRVTPINVIEINFSLSKVITKYQKQLLSS